MKILVANRGSTSFKYRLFDMTDETQLARGGKCTEHRTAQRSKTALATVQLTADHPRLAGPQRFGLPLYCTMCLSKSVFGSPSRSAFGMKHLGIADDRSCAGLVRCSIKADSTNIFHDL
jgi:hypothetical protein